MKEFRTRDTRSPLFVIALAILVFLAGCSGGNASRPIRSASSSPDLPSRAHFSFIVCGDPQNNYQVFGKILEAAKGVDFIIIAGDITGSGTRTEFTNFVNTMKGSGVRYYCVPGNHDVAVTPVEQNYTSFVGTPYQSFDYMNSHFVLIDNSTSSLGFYPGEQAWVRADLSLSSKKGFEHVFAVCHVPPGYPYVRNYDPTQEVGMQANAALVPVLSAGGVEELFCGHVHGFLLSRESGMTIKITGGAGAPLISGSEYYHYVLVEINGKTRDQKVVRLQ